MILFNYFGFWLPVGCENGAQCTVDPNTFLNLGLELLPTWGCLFLSIIFCPLPFCTWTGECANSITVPCMIETPERKIKTSEPSRSMATYIFFFLDNEEVLVTGRRIRAAAGRISPASKLHTGAVKTSKSAHHVAGRRSRITTYEAVKTPKREPGFAAASSSCARVGSRTAIGGDADAAGVHRLATAWLRARRHFVGPLDCVAAYCAGHGQVGPRDTWCGAAPAPGRQLRARWEAHAQISLEACASHAGRGTELFGAFDTGRPTSRYRSHLTSRSAQRSGGVLHWWVRSGVCNKSGLRFPENWVRILCGVALLGPGRLSTFSFFFFSFLLFPQREVKRDWDKITLQTPLCWLFFLRVQTNFWRNLQFKL